ncbi:MAG: YegS/Rv2252/BmrU family lipid kinase, partial [Clostridia bacterium]|nr:YegS/Rv2252/BmrU family lipid kinase [Clostridia bacterium]
MKELLFIINPYAGQQKGKRQLADILNIYNRAGFTVLTHVTAGQGDAEKACLRYADRVERIVCCGGDGTFNETASGVLKSGADVPIGYIPAGSTNDFAASLQLSTNIMQAARDVIEGTPMYVDMGTFAGRFFSYVASFGIFTRASYLTPQNAKNLLGHAAYVLGDIQELSQLRTWHMRFLLPDGTEIEDEFVFGAISNSTSVGGVLTLAKERVDLCDGKLELLLIRAPKDLKELAECVLALQRQT